MKKWFIILLIATIVSSIVAISFFLFGDKEQNILSKVPANAKSVMIIDLQALVTKLIIDDLGSDTKSAAKLSEMITDSLADIDWSKSGISLLEKIVLFTTENTDNDSIRLNLILRIANFKEFNNFINRLVENDGLDVIKNEIEKTAWSKQYRTLLRWNNNFVLVSLLTKNQIQDEKTLMDILSLKKEKSIMMDSSFMIKQATSFDILLYSLPYANYPKIYTEHSRNKYRQFIHSNIKSVVSLIKFNDGELHFEAELTVKKGSLLEKLFSIQEKDLPLLNILDSCPLNTILNINPQAFFQIIEQYSSVKFNSEKVPYFTAWDGRANILVNGSKIIKDEYITYDYDDDFNKIELKKTIKQKIWNIQAIIGVDETLLDSVFKKSKLYKSKKDTLLFKGGNFILKKTGNAYLCYNKHVNRPNLIGNMKDENISVEINYTHFIPLLKDIRITPDSLLLSKFEFEKFKLSVTKKEQVNISCSFYFANKEKNSFFSITEKWE